MSHEIEAIKDPGVPAHVHRQADSDPKAEKKAERQVAILFGLSAVGTLLFIYSYIWLPEDVFIYLPVLGTTNAKQLFLGLGLALSLFFIGAGAIHWAKTLMPDEEVIAMRHEMRSEDSDRKDFVASAKEGAAAAGLGRRSLIKRSLGLSLGLVGLSPLLLLRDLGPLPGKDLETTSWKSGTRLVTDPGDRPIKPSDLEVGAVAQVLPALAPGEERTLNNIGKDAVLLIRLRPEEFQLDAEKLAMTHEGIIAFSKICSHMGCAVAGPNLMDPAGNLAEFFNLPRLVGPYLVSATTLMCATIVIQVFLRPDPYLTAEKQAHVINKKGSTKAALAHIRSNPKTLFAISSIAIGHVAMVSVMVMTPIHMAHVDVTLRVIGFVISVHVLGMYAFSPLVGTLSDRLGRIRVIQIGLVILLSSTLIAGTAAADNAVQLGIGLFLLGLGWSCTLIAGSAFLSESVSLEMRPASQGASDLVMNLSGAGGGALAGVIIGTLNYGWLCLFASIPVIFLGIFSIRLQRNVS